MSLAPDDQHEHVPGSIPFDPPKVPRVTARSVYLCWLMCPSDDVVDELARLALSAIEERDIKAELLSLSLGQLHRLTMKVEALYAARRAA